MLREGRWNPENRPGWARRLSGMRRMRGRAKEKEKKTVVTISYKSISYDGIKGEIYIFHISRIGIIACHRPNLLVTGSNTLIMKHRIYRRKDGTGYIIIRKTGKGRIRVDLRDIKDAYWIKETIFDACHNTGISQLTMRRVAKKVELLNRDYPHSKVKSIDRQHASHPSPGSTPSKRKCVKK